MGESFDLMMRRYVSNKCVKQFMHYAGLDVNGISFVFAFRREDENLISCNKINTV